MNLIIPELEFFNLLLTEVNLPPLKSSYLSHETKLKCEFISTCYMSAYMHMLCNLQEFIGYSSVKLTKCLLRLRD